MASLIEAFPNAKVLLALQPEELGDVMIELVQRGISANPGRFGLNDFLYAVNHRDTLEWPSSVRAQVTQAVAEALAYLARCGADTRLYVNTVPVCLACSDAVIPKALHGQDDPKKASTDLGPPCGKPPSDPA
jgi:hypothetical protein